MADPTAIVFAADRGSGGPVGLRPRGRGSVAGRYRRHSWPSERSAATRGILAGVHPARFAAHEQFFAVDVPKFVASEFGLAFHSTQTAIFGASAGGELALALGLRHQGLYGAILAGSPGAAYRPPERLPTELPRTYLVVGNDEPFFLASAARWARALADDGGDVQFSRRDGDHGERLWRGEFPSMVEWAFG